MASSHGGITVPPLTEEIQYQQAYSEALKEATPSPMDSLPPGQQLVRRARQILCFQVS